MKGDSRGHWDADTFVVDTTNFIPLRNAGFFSGRDQELHVVERFTRTDADVGDDVR